MRRGNETRDDAPNGLQPSSGIGLTERRFTKTGVIESGHESLPDLKVDLNGTAASRLHQLREKCRVGWGGIQKEGLVRVRESVDGIFAREALHVIAASTDENFIAGDGDAEAGIVFGRTVGAYDVNALIAAEIVVDRDLFVGIGIERDSPLLIEHCRVLPSWVNRIRLKSPFIGHLTLFVETRARFDT